MADSQVAKETKGELSAKELKEKKLTEETENGKDKAANGKTKEEENGEKEDEVEEEEEDVGEEEEEEDGEAYKYKTLIPEAYQAGVAPPYLLSDEDDDDEDDLDGPTGKRAAEEDEDDEDEVGTKKQKTDD